MLVGAVDEGMYAADGGPPTATWDGASGQLLDGGGVIWEQEEARVRGKDAERCLSRGRGRALSIGF